MDTNDIARRWAMENLESNMAYEHLTMCVKACLRDIWFSRVKMAWKVNEVSTVCQFLFNLV